jgi:hypothetical protein
MEHLQIKSYDVESKILIKKISFDGDELCFDNSMFVCILYSNNTCETIYRDDEQDHKNYNHIYTNIYNICRLGIYEKFVYAINTDNNLIQLQDDQVHIIDNIYPLNGQNVNIHYLESSSDPTAIVVCENGSDAIIYYFTIYEPSKIIKKCNIVNYKQMQIMDKKYSFDDVPFLYYIDQNNKLYSYDSKVNLVELYDSIERIIENPIWYDAIFVKTDGIIRSANNDMLAHYNNITTKFNVNYNV